MTKLRFYGNMIFVLLFTFLGIFVSGNSLLLYVDIASLILGIILPYIIISSIYSPREQISFQKEIFKKEGQEDRKLLQQSISYLNTFKRLLIFSAIAWTIVGAIAIGVHLEGPEVLGVNFGVLMIIPLYVSVFLLIVIEPLRASAEKKLVE